VSESRVVATPDVLVPVPDGWVVVDDAPEAVVLAWPERPDDSFRPNVVVTRRPSDEPVPAASADVIAATLGLQRDAQVLAVEPLHDSAVPGRLVMYGYDSDSAYVCVQQWVFATGATHVHVTASCSIDEMLLVHPHFTELVRGLDFSPGGAP
jgi:hypothetical protein